MRPLLSVAEARALVLERAPAPRVEQAPLSEAHGRVLAEDVHADGDHPPFRRSRVDGYALRAADAAAPGAELPVAFEVPAGAPSDAPLPAGSAARIFTGGAVPEGADAVVMQEDCTAADGAVRIAVAVKPGAFVVPRGHECAAGAVVAAAGSRVTASLVGVLGSVGYATVPVSVRPTATVVSTGDELVPVGEVPGPGRIRNSNAPALLAAFRSFGADATRALTARDEEEGLRGAIETALEADVCVVTGGVSVGDYDLVPGVLAAAGVERVFHGVRLQPGKPLWFGVRGATLVFGLPGNPVSALVTATLFARPAIARALGLPDGPETVRAVLESDSRSGSWREQFRPVRVARRPDGRLGAWPVAYRGSGDVFGFSAADALLVVPPDAPERSVGDEVELVPLRGPLAP